MSRSRGNLRESALSNLIDHLHKERNLPKDILIKIVEGAVKQAALKSLGSNKEFEVSYDPLNPKQEITIFQFKISVMFIKVF